MILPGAARARGEVVLEVRVTAADLAHALERSLRERRAPEIRMDDDARRVQGPAQASRSSRTKLLANALDEISGLRAGLNLPARARENGPCGVDRERIIACPRQLVDRRQITQLHCASAFCGSPAISAQRVS